MAHTPPGRTRERVYRFVRERLLAGRPPSVREVQERFGFRAVESARAQLEALVAEGRLEKEPGVARGYRLPRAASRRSAGSTAPATALVPVVGRVQAGELTTALEEPEGFLAVQSRLPAEDLFALRVRGDSMRDAGILDGDMVVVRRQPAARDGEIVVALVGDEATVKTLRLRRGRVELHPANPDFAPIVPRAEEASILGRVVEVRRVLAGGV